MFDLTKQEYDNIVEQCMLNEELQKILEMKIKGLSIVEISFELGMCTRTVDRRVRTIKNKIKKVIK